MHLGLIPPKPTKEATMFKAYVMPAVAGAFLLGLATAAWAVNGEFGNMCAASLAAGKDTQTDCSINAQLEGKTYCFGSKEAMAEFMKAPNENLAKAQAYYSSKHPG
jgi:YHS domain-containing protein